MTQARLSAGAGLPQGAGAEAQRQPALCYKCSLGSPLQVGSQWFAVCLQTDTDDAAGSEGAHTEAAGGALQGGGTKTQDTHTRVCCAQ